MESLIQDWNMSLSDRCALVDSWNEDLMARYRNGEVLAETVLDILEPKPERLTDPSQSWIRAWKAQWGWSMLTRQGEEGAWLPYSSSDMEIARNQVKEMFSKKNCHRFLLLNYDQLWRNHWSASRHKLCYKARSGAGKRVRKTAIGMKVDKKVHAVKGSRQSVTVPHSNQRTGSM